MVSQFLSDMGNMIENAEQEQEFDLEDLPMNPDMPNAAPTSANG